MDLPKLSEQRAIVELFRMLGVSVQLAITAAEVATLSVDDVAALRELGLTEAMLEEVRAQAQHAPPDRIFTLDFERQTVTVEP